MINLSKEEKEVMDELRDDLERIVFKCFHDQMFDVSKKVTKEWLPDCIATVMRYHCYSNGTIPFPEEDEDDKEN